MKFTREQYSEIFNALATCNEEFFQGLAKAAIVTVAEIVEDMHSDLEDETVNIPTSDSLVKRAVVYVHDLDQENDTVMVQLAEFISKTPVQMRPHRLLKLNVSFRSDGIVE